MLALSVGVAGGIGSIARYLIDGTVQDRTSGILPFGTLTVNVIGSFVMGFLVGLVLFHDIADLPRTVLGTGFCGGLTTWSTASWETLRLVEEGSPRAAFLNAVGGMAASLAAAGCGLLLAFL